MELTIKPKQECRWDLVSLGESCFGSIRVRRHLDDA